MITIKEILALKPMNTEKRHSVERGGLYISVTPFGEKNWYYRYKMSGVSYWYVLGNFCTAESPNRITMDLKSARTQFYFERGRVENGINIQLIRIQKREEKPTTAYKVNDIVEDWKKIRQGKVVKNTWDKEFGRMEKYVLPKFGNKPLLKLNTFDIYNEMLKISESTQIGKCGRRLGGRETAKRTARHFSSLIDVAIKFGKVENNVAKGVAEMLPDHETVPSKALLEKNLLGAYLHEVENDKRKGDLQGIGVRLMPHVFVRHSEMLMMKWKELDFEKREWNRTISKQKKIAHRVYLSPQVIALLKEARMQTGTKEYVFHSNEAIKTGHISTLDTRLTQLGWKQKDKDQKPLERCVDMHGFRTTATSLGQDEELGDHALIDMCVGHKTKAVHGEAYDRATRYKERKVFMDNWSNFLDRTRKEYSVQQAKEQLKLA